MSMDRYHNYSALIHKNEKTLQDTEVSTPETRTTCKEIMRTYFVDD